MQHTDKLFRTVCLSCAALIALLTVGIFLQLGIHSSDAWSKFGLSFITSDAWDPATDTYGALANIVGTLLTTGIALLIAIPLAFVSALFVTEAPAWISRILSQCLDLLAAIPSVIYGMWGLYVLVPLVDKVVLRLIDEHRLLDIDFFRLLLGETCYGMSFLTAGLILALMILPYMSAVMRDVFRMTPPMLRESAYGIGCTRWEATRDVVMRYGIRGLLGGIFIGMGRALGETMAVLFVIGNIMEMPDGLLSSGTTIAATLACNFAEADGMQRSALFALGLILLLMSFGIQILSQYYLHLTRKKRGES